VDVGVGVVVNVSVAPVGVVDGLGCPVAVGVTVAVVVAWASTLSSAEP
jgi:hypothetical protein